MSLTGLQYDMEGNVEQMVVCAAAQETYPALFITLQVCTYYPADNKQHTHNFTLVRIPTFGQCSLLSLRICCVANSLK